MKLFSESQVIALHDALSDFIKTEKGKPLTKTLDEVLQLVQQNVCPTTISYTNGEFNFYLRESMNRNGDICVDEYMQGWRNEIHNDHEVGPYFGDYEIGAKQAKVFKEKKKGDNPAFTDRLVNPKPKVDHSSLKNLVQKPEVKINNDHQI